MEFGVFRWMSRTRGRKGSGSWSWKARGEVFFKLVRVR